jgi:hypothetical protein
VQATLLYLPSSMARIAEVAAVGMDPLVSQAVAIVFMLQAPCGGVGGLIAWQLSNYRAPTACMDSLAIETTCRPSSNDLMRSPTS